MITLPGLYLKKWFWLGFALALGCSTAGDPRAIDDASTAHADAMDLTDALSGVLDGDGSPGDTASVACAHTITIYGIPDVRGRETFATTSASRFHIRQLG